MNLTMSNTTQSLASDSNLFVNNAKILSVEAVNNPFPSSPYEPPDLAIKITFDVGASFQPEDIITGNFKKDKVSGEVIGWGSAFKVGDFFLKALGMTDLSLTDDNKIPEEYLTKAIGKSVLRLTYAYTKSLEGKNKFKSWNKYGDPSKPTEILIKGFHAQVEKGYVKDFLGHEEKTQDLPDVFPEDSSYRHFS